MSHALETIGQTDTEVLDWMARRLAWERMIMRAATIAETDDVAFTAATPEPVAATVVTSVAPHSARLRFGRRKLAA